LCDGRRTVKKWNYYRNFELTLFQFALLPDGRNPFPPACCTRNNKTGISNTEGTAIGVDGADGGSA
jgi:hypothetical protein